MAMLCAGVGIFTAAEDKRIHLTMIQSPKGTGWHSTGINELVMLRDGRLLAVPSMQNTVFPNPFKPQSQPLGSTNIVAVNDAAMSVSSCLDTWQFQNSHESYNGY